MLVRVPNPRGSCVGAVIAASVGAYVVVGAVAATLTPDGLEPVAAIWYVATSLGAIGIAALVAAATCWWARGFR